MKKLIPLTPQQYFDKIIAQRTPEDIQEVCQQLTTALFNDTDKPKTRVNKLTPYNKLIRAMPDDQLIDGENAYIQTKEDGTLWKRHLHFRYTGLEGTNFNGEGGINASSSKIERLDNRQKINVSAYLETTVKLLQSNDPHELAVGLIAASGRRTIEILARGNFSEVTELPEYLKSGYFVEFRGQAKKRDYNIPKNERAEYRIGVLVPAKMFLESFQRFDNMPETKEINSFIDEETKKGTSQEEINKKINDKRGNSLRRITERDFQFLPVRHGENYINNTCLRAAYVRLITERDCPKNMDGLLWAARAIGHFIDTDKPDDSELKHLITTLGYRDYYIDEPVPFVELEQKSIESPQDIKPVESLQDIKHVVSQEPSIKPLKVKKERVFQCRAYESDVEKLRNIQDEQNFNNQQDAIRYLFSEATKVSKLEKEIGDLKSKVVENKENKQEDMKPQNVTLSDDILEEKIEKVLQKLLPQLHYSQAESVNIASEVKKIKPEKPERNWESVPNEEVKATKARGAKIEKIRRSWLAIENYNNQATEKNQKWYVGLRTLSELSGCNGQDVSPWVAEHKVMIYDHNTKHELGVHHNKAHKNININDVIKWR